MVDQLPSALTGSGVEYAMVINGEHARAVEGGSVDVANPVTNETIGRVPAGTSQDVDRAVTFARQSFDDGRWRAMALADRTRILNGLADLLDLHADEIATLETLQTGTAYKLRRESDLPMAADNLRYFASMTRNLEGKAAAEYSGSHTSMIRREPIGVCAQITPWNYPLLMAVWKVAPALAAGNSVVLKPATRTPLTTIRLAELALEAGVPDGVLNVVTGAGPEVGSALASHPEVDLVSLTGSSETGRSIQSLAGQTVKRVHLELGGKAPAIVSKEADLDATTRGIAVGALVNGGQDCTAATRAYVQASIYEEFVERLKVQFESVRIGDPFHADTDLGSLIDMRHLERVEGYVRRALADGAQLVTGGRRAAVSDFEGGPFYLPTLVANASQKSELVQSEIFGPVLAVIPFETMDQAIDLANDTRYGLAASVWTRDVFSAMDAARRLNFGHVLINDHLSVASEMPHGGFKQSGFGKDMSAFSFDEYTQIKHVMVELTGEARKPWHYTVIGSAPG